MNSEVHPQPISERIKDICRDTAFRIRRAESTGRKSALRCGVYHYASDLLEVQAERSCADHYPVETDLLDGAADWNQYVWAGHGINNSEDICRLFCSPSQQKVHKYGSLPPRRGWNWFDFQVDRAMEASEIALDWLYEQSDLDGYNMLRIYSPKETSTVQHLVAQHDFDAEWTNNIAGKPVTKGAHYIKGCILECHSWRPEGYVDCTTVDGACSSMFLSHETLSQHTASLY